MLVLAVVACACSNYTSTTRKAREQFYAGKFSDAAAALEKGAHTEGVDQVLFLLDRATALHHASDYTESNKDFHLADKLTEIKDYTSITAEAVTLLSNDKILPYKGEEFEKVLISQYLALNYINLGMPEDALVECRRVNHKLGLLASKANRAIELSPMAYYLSAMLYESQGEWNDAYIDYQKAFGLKPDLSYLSEDLYRLAWKNKIRDDMQKWSERFKLSAEDQKRIKQQAALSEVVVVFEVGYSPEKKPNPVWAALPKYFPIPYAVNFLELIIGEKPAGRSVELYDIEAVTIQNLDEKFAGLLAKRVAGVVAKEVISDQVGKRTDPLIGALLKLGLHMADQADLRSWRTLPKNFQVLRTRMAPSTQGPVKLLFQAKGQGDAAASSAFGNVEKTIQLNPKQPAQKVFLSVRI